MMLLPCFRTPPSASRLVCHAVYRCRLTRHQQAVHQEADLGSFDGCGAPALCWGPTHSRRCSLGRGRQWEQAPQLAPGAIKLCLPAAEELIVKQYPAQHVNAGSVHGKEQFFWWGLLGCKASCEAAAVKPAKEHSFGQHCSTGVHTTWGCLRLSAVWPDRCCVCRMLCHRSTSGDRG